MYNQCNTGFNFGQTGCGGNTFGWNGGCYGGNTFGWNGGCCGNVWDGQTICRDACGNIHVNQRRRNCCCCYNLCGNGANNGTVTQNGNGQTGHFTCVTFCGMNNTTTTNAGELYYARQYGLPPFGYNRGCGCTLNAVSET